jgi:replicative DNA helicase
MIENTELLPPQDLAAERAVLGAMVETRWPVARARDVLSPEHFYAPKHATLYAEMLEMDAAGDPVDPVTVLDKLIRDGLISKIDGPYLNTLQQAAQHGAHAEHHARIVVDKWRLRRLSEAATRTQQLVMTGAIGGDVDEIIDRARAAVDEVANIGRAVTSESFSDAMDAYVSEADAPQTPTISTGIRELDIQLGGGLRAGQLIIVGARPGVGKSVLAVNIATAAAEAGHGVFFASLEMSNVELMHRLVASVGDVSLENLISGNLTAEQRRRRESVKARTATWPLKIDENPRQSITTIRAAARDRTRSKRGLGVLIVDYLQLMGNTGRKHDRRDLEVGENTRGLKILAKELGIAVVALSQINRGPEARADKRPNMADLRESGSIEADADTVLLLHRDPADPEGQDFVEVIVPKQRSGPTGTINLFWSGPYQRITGKSSLRVVS